MSLHAVVSSRSRREGDRFIVSPFPNRLFERTTSFSVKATYEVLRKLGNRAPPVCKCYESDDGGLVVIFNRRRLGRMRLFHQFLTDRDDAVVYQATEITFQVPLDEFVDVAAETLLGVIKIK